MWAHSYANGSSEQLAPLRERLLADLVFLDMDNFFFTGNFSIFKVSLVR